MATVLIAAPAYLTVLKARPELNDAIAFADADVLQALEAITSLRPAVVVLEKQFADTSRGSALINRIKADSSLKPCDIQIVLHEGHAVEHVPPTPEPVEQPVLAPIDFRGTRRAERFAIKQGVEVHIEGSAAQLVNMSAVGAQVLSSSIVKPNQRVRLALSAQAGAARIASLVAWASFELPLGVACYRAGIEFLPPFDHSAVNKFIKRHKA